MSCASPFGYPALYNIFNISAEQARLVQFILATDIFTVFFLKYYTNKILRIAILGQTKGQAHTLLLHNTLPASNYCQLSFYIAIYLYVVHCSSLNLCNLLLNPFQFYCLQQGPRSSPTHEGLPSLFCSDLASPNYSKSSHNCCIGSESKQN